jgi:hypothetical protein
VSVFGGGELARRAKAIRVVQSTFWDIKELFLSGFCFLPKLFCFSKEINFTFFYMIKQRNIH